MFEMEHLIWIYSSLLAALTIDLVSARFCEGGNHRCMPPKECCAQGCCYLYSPPSAPRSQQPTDHVLNLFFINHWYFWLFLFAIVIALLLICSLWKKRHTLFCAGWSTSSNHRTPSEGDSAGSCYAPPHYSRCSSFYHAPPPYAEVTSKPDLYPLVFSYTNDGSKNGSSNGNGANYLMVQYFRNYIVRPIGSLSATSTIDSLSSSFICTANEANTMIPPPYSSAASPDDLSMSLQNYAIPRSASQQGYINNPSNHHHHHRQIESQMLTGNASAANININHNRPMSVPNTNNHGTISSHYHFRASESANFGHLFQASGGSSGSTSEILANIPTSSSSTMTTTHTTASSSRNHNASISDDDNCNNNNIDEDDDDDDEEFHQASEGGASSSLGNAANGSLNQISIYHSNDTMSSLSAAMIEKIAYSKQTNDHTKLNMIQKQLEKCCELIQQQQQQIQQTRSHFNITSGFDSASESPISCEIAKKMSESAIMGLGYLNSNTGSTVSSLANLTSPSSPPRATSPTTTQEVKDLLEQIKQLKDKTFSDEELNYNFDKEADTRSNLPGPSTSTDVATTSFSAPPRSSLKRPTSLSNKRRFFNVKNRSVYIPVSSNPPPPFASPSGFNAKLRSPIASNGCSVFMSKARRNVWGSKSAPTTPGAGFTAGSCINDHSPLLYEQDEEDAEMEDKDRKC